METTFNNQPADDMMAEPARPQFLSVLCILTWVCCAFIFVTTIWGVVFQPSPEKQLEEIEKIRALSPEAADKMEAALDNQAGNNQAMNTGISLIALALSAYGTYMMWQLKKRGFFLYIAGELLPYLSFLIGGAAALSAAGSMTGMGDAFVGIAIGVMALFDGIFIAMYAMNVKYMNK